MTVFNLSESGADTLYSVANIAVLLAAIVGVTGAICLFWATGFREKFASIRELGTQERITDSQTLASQADERAADANKTAALATRDAAKANERAAILEKEAAASRLELMKLQQKLAWRVIEEPARAAFIAATNSAPKSKIQITYLSNNEEVLNFAAQLSEMFIDAGYDSPDSLDKMGSFMPIGGLSVGVILTVKDENSQEGVHLQRALMLIGIEAPVRFNPQLDDDLHLEIGAKPTNK